jgi:methionyl-tRNA formyltransferase
MVIAEAPSLRIAFFGTPDFAVPTLTALLSSRHQVVGIVTQPDRPRGRGQRLQPSPVKDVGLRSGILVLQPERLKTEPFLQAFATLEADLAVVAAYGRILTESLLRRPRLGFINIHASLLPKYRGAAPVHRAVLAGETETGVTIMRIVRELDAGPMLAAARRPIGPNESSVDVERDLAALGARLLVATVDRLSVGPVEETPQDHTQATYAPRLEKAEGLVDWTESAPAIHNRIRGLQPWPHAFTSFNDRRCILLRSELGASETWGSRPGRIMEIGGDSLTVSTGQGAIRLLRLQVEGGRALSAAEFVAGYHVLPGALFGQGSPPP